MNEIVAACQYQDMIIIFTRNGDIYRMWMDHVTGQLTFSKFMELFPR